MENHDLFPILYEDADLLVINKPAGLVCHPTKGDARSSLISRVRLHVGAGCHPHLVNRLDRETSGVTLVAKRDDVALELRQLWEGRLVEKEYLAIVHGHPKQDHHSVDAALGKDEASRIAIKDCVRSDGLPARTEYWVDRRFWRGNGDAAPSKPFSLLRVMPHTGRKHQIRIHLAHIGYPIVGDKLYGGDEDLYLALVENRLSTDQWAKLILPHHALHARQVRFTWRGEARSFEAAPESWFSDWLSQPTCPA
jgi:23S rRNA pseudouridine1911/1915/1917 synthase